MIFQQRHQLIILLLLCIAVNANTLFNEYSIDDGVVLVENQLVAKGIKGIPELFKTDYFFGYKDKGSFSTLAGARYRPVVLSVFALEYQFFAANPMVSHLINVLLFALSVFLLFKLLSKYLFREKNQMLAFVVCLLFAVHPIHTEVIANVKSRDELIAFILLISSLLCLVKYSDTRRTIHLAAGLVFFFAALLSKETAITFVAVVPLVMYFFFGRTIKQSVFFATPLVAVVVAYMALRFFVVGFGGPSETDILNSPFLLATHVEAFATKIFILAKYIGLLIFPHPLSCDYGYNQIPYLQLSSVKFIFSLLLILTLVVCAFFAAKTRSLMSFSIFYFFVTLSVGTNFIVDLGAFMAERMLFLPSLAYCIVVAVLYYQIKKKYKIISVSILSVVLVLFSVKTVARNFEWKNVEALCLADVTTSPESFRITFYATEIFRSKAEKETDGSLRKEYLKKAQRFGEHAVRILPNYVPANISLGLIYLDQMDHFKAADRWMKAYQLDSTSQDAQKGVKMLSGILYKQGNACSENGNAAEAIKYYKRSVELDPNNVESWYDLGGTYFTLNDSVSAMNAWEVVKTKDPQHKLDKKDFVNK